MSIISGSIPQQVSIAESEALAKCEEAIVSSKVGDGGIAKIQIIRGFCRLGFVVSSDKSFVTFAHNPRFAASEENRGRKNGRGDIGSPQTLGCLL